MDSVQFQVIEAQDSRDYGTQMRNGQQELPSGSRPVLQAMFTFNVDENNFKVSDLTYLRPKAGGNLIHRSKDFKHVTADVTKRTIIGQNEGKRIDEFGKNLVFQAETYASLPVVNMIDHFDKEYPQGVGADGFKLTLENMNTAKDQVWEMSEIFAKAEGDMEKQATAFKLQNRIVKLLKLMDEFRDQMPLATVFDPSLQKQQRESDAMAKLEGDDEVMMTNEQALWTLLDPQALKMVLNNDLDQEKIEDAFPWLNEASLGNAFSFEIEEREEEGGTRDGVLRDILAAEMIRTHITLMRSTFGEKADIINDAKSVRKMLENNGLGLDADGVLKAMKN